MRAPTAVPAVAGEDASAGKRKLQPRTSMPRSRFCIVWDLKGKGTDTTFLFVHRLCLFRDVRHANASWRAAQRKPWSPPFDAVVSGHGKRSELLRLLAP